MFDDRTITVINELSEEFEVDWERKLELTKQQALTAQGNVKTNPRVVVELLEKVMILQAFNSQGCFSTETAIRQWFCRISRSDRRTHHVRSVGDAPLQRPTPTNTDNHHPT